MSEGNFKIFPQHRDWKPRKNVGEDELAVGWGGRRVYIKGRGQLNVTKRIGGKFEMN